MQERKQEVPNVVFLAENSKKKKKKKENTKTVYRIDIIFEHLILICLTLCMQGKISADDILKYCFLIFLTK